LKKRRAARSELEIGSCKFKAAGLNAQIKDKQPGSGHLPNYQITQLPNFICSFHAATCAETLSLSITSLSGAPAFHSLLTDCTLPAGGLPYMLRSSQPTCDTFISEPLTEKHGQAF
jgi:hypothetical protein